MPTRDKIETLLDKRLRYAMSAARMSVSALADSAGVSEATIKKYLGGRVAKPRVRTLEKIADALGRSVDYFTQGVFTDEEEALSDMIKEYGPSAKSGLKFGGFRTHWLNYDLCGGSEYGLENVTGLVSDRMPNFPPKFLQYRDIIVEKNNSLIGTQRDGQAFFDGPSFCLSHYSINHTADGHEEKSVSVEFLRSRYANNVTAKSGTASTLRKKALQSFEFLDQPIEWLASGVGVAVVVFCDAGERIIICRRSDRERFRSRQFDVSVVEGINPIKDIRSESETVYVYDAVRRGVEAELGFEVRAEQVKVIGFGLDLEYYQWNFIAYVETDLSFSEIEMYWQGAEEKFETMELSSVSSSPKAAAKFAASNPIWSCGLAALYFSLLKRNENAKDVIKAFVSAFEDALAPNR